VDDALWSPTVSSRLSWIASDHNRLAGRFSGSTPRIVLDAVSYVSNDSSGRIVDPFVAG
jgi:hypothetical protein